MATKQIITIRDLQVVFDNIKALNIQGTIEINEGDIVAIIGKNGAGKSTLINSIINQVHYKGMIECNFQKDDLGIQFQHNSYNKIMKVFELIQIVTGKSKFNGEIKELINEFELDSLLKKKVGKLSGGELQRLTLFLVLYLKPKIMIFDELTTGLDFEKRNKLLKIIREYSKGKTVLSVSHYFEEFSQWANKYIILNKGNLVFFGTLEELKAKYPHEAILKVKKSNRETIEKLAQKYEYIQLVEDFNDDVDAVIIRIEQDEQKVINIFIEEKIQYEMMPCNIYSLYSLAINNFKGGE